MLDDTPHRSAFGAPERPAALACGDVAGISSGDHNLAGRHAASACQRGTGQKEPDGIRRRPPIAPWDDRRECCAG
jgi:hypothetical protein